MSLDITSEDVNRILYLLAEHKKSLGNLYQNYHQKFPEQDYWIILAEAKQKNNQTIQSIYFDSKNDKINFDETVFRSAAIKTSLEWIWRLIEESAEHSLINALSYSLDIEQSRIEQKYFDIFKTESAEINRLIPALAQESQEHILILRTELKKIKEDRPF